MKNASKKRKRTNFGFSIPIKLNKQFRGYLEAEKKK